MDLREFESVRDFLTKRQRNLYSGQTCQIRISDLDGYRFEGSDCLIHVTVYDSVLEYYEE